MSGRYTRPNVMTYVPWVLVAFLSVEMFFSSEINPYSHNPARPTEGSNTMASRSIFRLSLFHSSSNKSAPIIPPTTKDQAAIVPISVIPPWTDTIIVPELENTKAIHLNDGKCVIGETEWEKCGTNDRFCAAHGEGAVAASQIHVGQTKRIQRVIRKAIRGEPVTLAVIGGSVTTGVGIFEKPMQNYKYQLFNWWNYAFPDSQVTFIDGGVHGQGSPFFSVCFGAVLPQDVDIVFIDSAINDVYKEQDAINAESLMRGIMQMPNQPAIVLLQTFGMTFDKIATGGALHLDIAAYYDIPVLSARQVILPYIFNNSDSVSRYFGLNPDGTIDLRHISVVGHTIMAEMAIELLSSVLCKVQRDQFLHGEKLDPPLLDPPADLSKHRLMDRYDANRTYPVYAPLCNSTESKFRPLVPSAPTSWTPEVIKGKNTLTGHVPGEEVRFKVNLVTGGTLQVNHLRSSFYDIGIGKCYIESFGPESAVVLDGYWTHNYSVGDLVTLKENLPAGEYEIICTVQEETNSPKGGKKVMIVSVQSF